MFAKKSTHIISMIVYKSKNLNRDSQAFTSKIRKQIAHIMNQYTCFDVYMNMHDFDIIFIVNHNNQ